MEDDADPNPCEPKSSYFLGCFGFSGKRKAGDKVDNRSRLFRRSTLVLKQSGGTKTVPLDSATSQKIKNCMFNKSKLKNNAAVKEESLEKENGKYLDNMKGCRNESFRRRIRKAYSQPGSPPGTNGITVSFPGDRKEMERVRNKNDALMGMSIIMVTLVIILIWGRICAIICTCTWLYFVPRLRLRSREPQLPQNDLVLDFKSDNYKKKRVVFQGFLDRNHNRSL
ncbi:uncharacterized protein At5g23160 [Euphorbia lathyris]|uniref:uncharacterized protein At5g23160 n=1 Tax=Euphorbia lathyris TaxID=212925 RepID=UPI0033142B6A